MVVINLKHINGQHRKIKMRKGTIILLIMCAIVSWDGTVAHASQNKNKYKDSSKLAEMHTLNRIHSLQATDSIATALLLVDSLLAGDSASPKLLTLKGELFLLAGDTNKAEEILAGVVASMPIASSTRQLLVEIEISRGKFEEAKKNLTYLKMIGRNKYKVLFLQGKYFDALHKPDSASVYYQKAVEHLLKKKRSLP